MLIHKSFGLDLGTTNSTASLVKNGKVVFAEEGKTKNKTIPSIFAQRRNGQQVVGTAAKNEFYSGNINSKKSVKRDMGKQVNFAIGDAKYSPEEISAKIITFCKECLLDTIMQDADVVYDQVVITVPAYFNLAQKDATRKAGEIAGLKVQMLLEEPTGAAINYAIQNNVENGLFFVLDLGGGTFDVSILEKIGSIPSVLATAGNNFLGGDNFDFILARYFMEHLETAGFNVSDIVVDSSNNKFRLLMLAAENVKKQLSQNETYDIYFPDVFRDNSGIELSIEDFSRSQFNDLIRDKIEIDVLKECDKALEILEKNYGKTINDITHILLVGGSTKIPFVQQLIRDKYCVTEKLADVISYEPDLSVSAGAALVANSNGFQIEDKDNDTVIQMNAPYILDNMVYLSGSVIQGDINKVGLNNGKKEMKVDIMEDKTFIFTIPVKEYKENSSYSFYRGDVRINNLVNEDSSANDIIAPTPIQNETIAIEIIDVENGSIQKYPIVQTGESLPCKSIETFKINEYSNEQIVLPIWEGARKIFNLVIDLPNDVKIGSKIIVTTHVDMISNVTLDVELDGKKLEGKYEKIISNEIDDDVIYNLDAQFEQRIEYIKESEKRNELISQKADIDRELSEATDNNDENHFATVSSKYEKVVADMPSMPALSDEQFNIIGDSIKEKLVPELKYTEFDVDNLCFYGKRYIKKGNMVEAQKCMTELLEMKRLVDLLNSPRTIYDNAKIAVIQSLLFADDYRKSGKATSAEKAKIDMILNNNFEPIQELLNKYDDNTKETPQMKEDAITLLQLSAELFSIMEKAAPEENSKVVSIYKGLVSKA